MDNEYARSLANKLHVSGLPDSKIAELTGVTRPYINRIRNGKVSASQDLEAKLQELCNSEVSLQPQEHSIPLEDEREEYYNEASGFSSSPILIGLAIVGIIVFTLFTVVNVKHKK